MVDSLTTLGNSTNRDLKGAGVSLMAATKLSPRGGEGELSAGKERREETSTRRRHKEVEMFQEVNAQNRETNVS